METLTKQQKAKAKRNRHQANRRACRESEALRNAEWQEKFNLADRVGKIKMLAEHRAIEEGALSMRHTKEASEALNEAVKNNFIIDFQASFSEVFHDAKDFLAELGILNEE